MKKNKIIFLSSLIFPLISFAIPNEDFYENFFGYSPVSETIYIPFAKIIDNGMSTIMKAMVVLILAIMILNFMWIIFKEGLKINLNSLIVEIIHEMITSIVILAAVSNWYGFSGNWGVYPNILKPLIFQKIPYFITGIHFSFDNLWDIIFSIPYEISQSYNFALLLVGLFSVVFLGFALALLLMSFLMMILTYILAFILYLDVVIMILKAYLLCAVSPIMFPLMLVPKLKERFGMSAIKTMMSVTIQFIGIVASIQIGIISLNKVIYAAENLNGIGTGFLVYMFKPIVVAFLAMVIISFTSKVIKSLVSSIRYM